jgi:CTP synthase (UTP-ammonia lyase)
LFQEENSSSKKPFKAFKYLKTLFFALKHAISQNDKGKKYPVFGTCQGFQAMILYFLEQKEYPLLESGFDEVGVLNSVSKTKEFKESVLFNKLEKIFGDSVANEVLDSEQLYLHHMKGFSLISFEDTKALSENFRVLGTSRSKKTNKEYISWAEHKKYPFFGSQMHMEKSVWAIWDSYDFVSRSKAVREFTFQMAMTFVSIASGNEGDILVSEDGVDNYLDSN